MTGNKTTWAKAWLLAIMIGTFLLSGCATAGQKFSAAAAKKIEIGKTTKQELRSMLGPPWRMGLEDGQETWTYGYYRYHIFKPEQSTDLIVRFEKAGIVASYSFSTTDYE